MAMTKDERLRVLSRVFTPSAPVARRDLFAGRIDQVFEITGALSEAGRHIAIYGERGVGKTSLANVLRDLMVPITGTEVLAVKINCSTSDTFTKVWKRAFRELAIDAPENWALGKAEPDEVRLELAKMHPPAVIIFDEFDRIEDDDSLTLFADLIKSLSDNRVESKVVVVGVADSIDQLVGEHESVQRALAEVNMPRMTEEDMNGIIDGGLGAAELAITDRARARIRTLAEGLPHYVHELSLRAALNAVREDRGTLTTGDVSKAIEYAVERHSLVREYQHAVQSPRRDNLFARVLTACALAEKNRLGAFTSAAVRDPLSRIMGRQYEIPAFAPHLKAFTGADRGSVLRQEGTTRRYTYRFRNPLLQPFTLLTALKDGLIPEDLQAEILGADDEVLSE